MSKPVPLKELLETGAGLHPEEVPYEMARRLRALDDFVSRGAVREPLWRQHVRRILDGEKP